jgi:hypothetical protein
MLEIKLEARGGIEPPNKGFADLCLTTWLPRHSDGFTMQDIALDAAKSIHGATGSSSREARVAS